MHAHQVTTTAKPLDEKISASMAETLKKQEEALLKQFLKTLDTTDHFVIPEEKLTDEAKKDKTIVPAEGCTVNIRKKQFKSGGSDHRNQGEWVEIANSNTDAKNQDFYYRFLVFAGELMRFERGDLSPKYRIEQANDGRLKLLSRKLENMEPGDFGDFYEKSIKADIQFVKRIKNEVGEMSPIYEYKGDLRVEGLGILHALNYTYRENDINIGNVLIAKFGDRFMFVGIDHEQKLWPLAWYYCSVKTRSIFSLDHVKQMTYMIDLPGATHRKRGDYETSYVITTTSSAVKLKDMGQQHEQDYQDFPFLHHRTPLNSPFADAAVQGFCKAMAETPAFQNEVCYHRLKICFTPFIKQFLSAVHFDHFQEKQTKEKREEFLRLKAKTDEMIESELKQAWKLCKESKEIHDYLDKNRNAVFKAIIYELWESFNNNPHYLPKDRAEWRRIWKELAGITIQHFDRMLSSQLLLALTESEKDGLKNFAFQVDVLPEKAVTEVIQFFEKQERFIVAERMKAKKCKLEMQLQKRFVVTAEDALEQSASANHDLAPGLGCVAM